MTDQDHQYLAAAQRYLSAVRRFAEVVMEDGRDRYGDGFTPSFVDGLHTKTREPASWKVNGETWILSNLGNQQVLLRTLQGLTQLTGETRYRSGAMDAVDFAFTHLRSGKLLALGGHMAYDLGKKQVVYAPDKGPVHELKCHYPFYDLMWEVDADETVAYIDAIWESHVRDWGNLEFSRHGRPVQVSQKHDIWNQAYTPGDVFFVGQGLTFINAGSDLIYAAALLSDLINDNHPLIWSRRLANRYVETRNPATGLGGYQFSISVLPGPNGRGDRAMEQFGEQLKEHAPNEANLCAARQVRTILTSSAINRMLLSERLAESGREFLDGAVEDLLAYAEYSYDAKDNVFHPVMTDGYRLTGLVMAKSGYYGLQGQTLKPITADFRFLWSYTLAYRLSVERPLVQRKLWRVVRSIAQGLGLGDVGDRVDLRTVEDGKTLAGPVPSLVPVAVTDDPLAIFAVLELYKATRDSAYLDYGVKLGDELLRRRFHGDLFVPGPNHRYAKLDAVEPLALLHLVGQLSKREDLVPMYWASTPFFGSEYDGLGHQVDNHFLYGQTSFRD